MVASRPLGVLLGLLSAVPAAAQSLPIYHSANPVAEARSGLYFQPLVAPAAGWGFQVGVDYASMLEFGLRTSVADTSYLLDAEVLRVNLMAPMKMAEAFVENVAASTQKKIVAISSTEGSSPNAKGGIYAYRTSKAALNMLMQNLAPDLAPRGIATAAFCPGWIRTRMGGANAPLEAPPSIAGLRRVIEGLTPERSGRFWLWDGRALPW